MHAKFKSGPETDQYGYIFTAKYTKPPARIHVISDSRCNVTRITVPAGCVTCIGELGIDYAFFLSAYKVKVVELLEAIHQRINTLMTLCLKCPKVKAG